EQADRALAISEEVDYPQGVASARSLLGLLAQAEGDLSLARAHLKAAVETYWSIEAALWAALAQLDLAAVALAEGQRGEARRLVQEAAQVFTALDLPRQAEYTGRVASELGIALGAGEQDQPQRAESS